MWKRAATAGALLPPLCAWSLAAMADVDVVVHVAPPAPRVEVIPAPRTGHAWDRDRDNDGVRNRRDRDGDGVRNRRDARPGNPHRR